MKKIVLASVLAALLGGCASSVKLDTPPVEDKSGTPVSSLSGGNADAGKTGVGTSREVTPVDLGKTGLDKMGPAGDRIVFFDYDSFIVKSEYQALLDAQARYLKADRSRKSVVEGHTDERGGREYNLALGQKRAEAVRRAMGLLGVADAQVEAVSFGKEKPLATGTDEASLAKNRRAEVTYRP
jgi:peptidoglycan-associated lipoprotein